MLIKMIVSTALAALLAAGLQAREERPLWIRVLEKTDPKELSVRSPAGVGDWSAIKLSRGQWSVNGKAQNEAFWGSLDSTVEIKAGNLTRIYPGLIRVSAATGRDAGEALILNEVEPEDYEACVTAFESGYDRSQPEYLKALAVIVRSFALSHRGRHGTYDLCDLTHCQVYQGIPPHFDFWKRIVEAGRDFTWPDGVDERLLFFNRCCGGMLESADQVWGGAPSPNRTGADELDGETLCRSDPFFRWTSSTDAQNMEAAFIRMSHLPAGAHLKSLEISQKTPGGRNQTFEAVFELPDGQSRVIRENVPRFISEFGRLYGWRTFPSSFFDVRREGSLFHFSGRGLGHGVGLCQSGALRLAQMGWPWRRILDFYFPPPK